LIPARYRCGRAEPVASTTRLVRAAPVTDRVAAAGDLRARAADRGACPAQRSVPTPALLALYPNVGHGLSGGPRLELSANLETHDAEPASRPERPAKHNGASIAIGLRPLRPSGADTPRRRLIA
jgi:hypothetical protein